MLWRARQAFRHYQRAVGIHPGRYSSTRLLILFTLARAQWTSLAVASRPLHHTPRISTPNPTYLAPANGELSHRPAVPHKTIVYSEHARAVDGLYSLLMQGKLDDIHAMDEYTELLSVLRVGREVRELAIAMVAADRPQRSVRVLRLAHHCGCQCKLSIYENVAHALAGARQWTLVLHVVKLARHHTDRVTTRLLNWRLRALMELGRFKQIENIPDEFKASHLERNRLSFHLLISANLRNRNLPKAREFLVEMEQAGIPTDASTHANIAMSYRTLGLEAGVQERAVASLKDLDGRQGTAVLNSLIRMSLDKGDVDGAAQYISFLDQPSTGLERRLVDGGASTLLDEEDSGSSRTDRVAVSASSSLSPDIATFTMLVEHLGRARELSRIPQVVRRMKYAGVIPDARFAEALVHAYAVGGDTATAVSLAFTVCSSTVGIRDLFARIGLKPTDHGRPDLLSPTLQPTERIFTALLQGVLKVYGLAGMLAVTRIMAIFKITPGDALVETVLIYMKTAMNARPQDLVAALHTLRPLVQPSLRHTLVILGLIVRDAVKAARKGSWYATLATFQGVKQITNFTSPPEADPFPAIKSVDPIPGAAHFDAFNDDRLLLSAIKHLVLRGVRRDRAAVALRMRYDAIAKRNVMKAQDALQEMLAQGIHPNRYHFAALLEGFTLVGDMPTAQRIMRASMKAGFPPDLAMYTILITGFAYQNKPILALRTFQTMVAEGISPDHKAISILANAFVVAGDYPTAKKVLLELWHYVGTFPSEAQHLNYKELLKAFEATAGARNRPPKMQSKHIPWLQERLVGLVKSAKQRRRSFIMTLQKDKWRARKRLERRKGRKLRAVVGHVEHNH
ncbi:hypothetical protein EIP91_005559 [Steccherinum ochraceum]|uniref:Pentacotripeptide-repeat region of PRORP domain-containing protein n=1 Tax=Steccherinum ochraceum TaxID=92696 RepID=A0A4R0RMH4_9APHY|nr:hypothetical protein EIP91_005559 [Steccherinum ochraceum]